MVHPHILHKVQALFWEFESKSFGVAEWLTMTQKRSIFCHCHWLVFAWFATKKSALWNASLFLLIQSPVKQCFLWTAMARRTSRKVSSLFRLLLWPTTGKGFLCLILNQGQNQGFTGWLVDWFHFFHRFVPIFFGFKFMQDGTGDGFNDAMSDMGLSDVSTLCPGDTWRGNLQGWWMGSGGRVMSMVALFFSNGTHEHFPRHARTEGRQAESSTNCSTHSVPSSVRRQSPCSCTAAQPIAPSTHWWRSFLDAGRSVHGNVVLRVKGTFMESGAK